VGCLPLKSHIYSAPVALTGYRGLAPLQVEVKAKQQIEPFRGRVAQEAFE